MPWISAACALVGAGLGPSSMSQVLAIQNVVAERQRGVATSLVPFFRTIGGSIGVGAMGGLLAAGCAEAGPGRGNRGPAARHGSGAAGTGAVAPAVFRLAIERSLLPVFAILGVLAVVNVFVTERFPAEAEIPAERRRRGDAAAREHPRLSWRLPSRQFRVRVDQCEAAVRLPALGETAHLLPSTRADFPAARRQVLDHAEVARRKDVRAPQTAQESDLGGPAARPREARQRLDRRLVGQRRHRVLRQRSLRERAGQAPDRARPCCRRAGTAAARRGVSRARASGAGNATCVLPADARAAPERQRELAADVVGEPQVDLLAEDRGDQRLPERRNPAMRSPRKSRIDAASSGSRGARAVERLDVGARAERAADQPSRGARRPRATPRRDPRGPPREPRAPGLPAARPTAGPPRRPARSSRR